MYNRKWKPSKSAKREFAAKMDEIEQFIQDHDISASATRDSYYFWINDQYYRVSNHAVESRHNWSTERQPDIIYIHAGKTRIKQIYNDLAAGHKLDGHGTRID